MPRRKIKNQLSFDFNRKAAGFQLTPSPSLVTVCQVCGYPIWERYGDGEAQLVRVGKHGDCWGKGNG